MTIPSEIPDLIEKSGNSFHARVARFFRDSEWHVVISPYYLDQSQGKAREIDLIVEKLWPVRNEFGDHIADIAVRLFVECKYISTFTVFWFSDKDLKAAEDLICTGSTFSKDNVFTKEHHYLSQGREVAKLFSSRSSKTQENDPFYKALNQALNGMVSLRNNQVSIPKGPKKQKPIKAVLDYPIVMCNSFSKLYRTDFYNDTDPERIDENFQLEVRYAYVNRNNNQIEEYFLLDIVEFDKLEALIDSINTDAEKAVYLAY